MPTTDQLIQEARKDPMARAILEQAESMGYDVKSELKKYLENSKDPKLRAYLNKKQESAPRETRQNSNDNSQRRSYDFKPIEKRLEEIYNHTVKPDLEKANQEKYFSSLLEYVSKNPKEALEKVGKDSIKEITKYLAGKKELEEIDEAMKSKRARELLHAKYNNPAMNWVTETIALKMSYSDIEEKTAEYARYVKQVELSKLEKLDDKKLFSYVLSEISEDKSLYELLANHLANKGYKPKTESLEDKATSENKEPNQEKAREKSGLEDKLAEESPEKKEKKDDNEDTDKKKRKNPYNHLRNLVGLEDEELPTDDEIAGYKKELRTSMREDEKWIADYNKQIEEDEKNKQEASEKENQETEKKEAGNQDDNLKKALKESKEIIDESKQKLAEIEEDLKKKTEIDLNKPKESEIREERKIQETKTGQIVEDSDTKKEESKSPKYSVKEKQTKENIAKPNVTVKTTNRDEMFKNNIQRLANTLKAYNENKREERKTGVIRETREASSPFRVQNIVDMLISRVNTMEEKDAGTIITPENSQKYKTQKGENHSVKLNKDFRFNGKIQKSETRYPTQDDIYHNQYKQIKNPKEDSNNKEEEIQSRRATLKYTGFYTDEEIEEILKNNSHSNPKTKS